jgi:N-acetylglucosaminyldiphosphoundecaprenol N-acetyl-beta-D-mannosaminyltransferase
MGIQEDRPNQVNVIDSPVTVLTFDQQIEKMLQWAHQRLSRFVCVANVHMLMEAHWQEDMQTVLQGADLVAPDGMPLVWMMRLLGAQQQDRVAGMDIFLTLCDRAAAENVSIYLVGSTPEVLSKMKERLAAEFPNLFLAGVESLPFRPLTSSEDAELVDRINESGAGIVMVALGCPKQERWMAQHRDRINAVMVGLGGVFPIYAGLQKRAPKYLRENGLEWLYRLVQEPRRLWKRYGTTIPPFVWLAMQQLMQQQRVQRSCRT